MIDQDIDIVLKNSLDALSQRTRFDIDKLLAVTFDIPAVNAVVIGPERIGKNFEVVAGMEGENTPYLMGDGVVAKVVG